MTGLRYLLNAIRGLGYDRLRFLGVVTGGHSVIHWYMEIFPVVLPSIKAGLRLNDVEIGALMTARQLASGTLNLPSGMLADSLVNYRPLLLAVAPVTMGLAYALFGVSPGFVWAVAAAGLVGLATALWHPAALASLSHRFPESRATAIAVHGMGATVSNTITPLGVGTLLVVFPWRDVLGYQMVPALIVGFLVWRGLVGVVWGTGSNPKGSTQIREIGKLATDPVFIGIAVIRGLMRMGRSVILTFFPIYLQEHLGYSPMLLGFYLTMLYGIGIVSQPVIAVLSDRFGRKTVLLPSFFVMGLLYLLLWIAAPGIQLGIVVAAIGIFFFTLGNVTTAAIMDVAGSGIQASSFGLSSLLTQVIALPAPILAGFLIDLYGIGAAFILSSAFLFLAGFVVLPLRLYRRD